MGGAIKCLAGQNSLSRRKADYERIERKLTVNKERSHVRKATDRSDVTILFGDLNYRVNASVGLMRYLIEQGQINSMTSFDELKGLLGEGQCMQDFTEGEIAFAPTFKFNTGGDTYVLHDTRIPSYTDRILYKCKHKNALKLEAYDSNNLLKSSDHRPVFAQFVCDIEGDFADCTLVQHGHEAVRQISRKETAFGKCRRAICSII